MPSQPWIAAMDCRLQDNFAHNTSNTFPLAHAIGLNASHDH